MLANEAQQIPELLEAHDNHIAQRDATIERDYLIPSSERYDREVNEAEIDLDNYTYTNNEFMDEVVALGYAMFVDGNESA
jgi:hypothetical protein